MPTEFDRFYEAIGYRFQDEALVRQALTHSSFANERKRERPKDYERLEFLGDAVLELVSSAFLFSAYPDKKEGELTKLRASLVCEAALAKSAGTFFLRDYLFLGKGEEAQGGRDKASILSDVVEAVIGALYLDGGMEAATDFIHRFILNDAASNRHIVDAKSALQEYVQKRAIGEVRYALKEETGPEHAKTFTVAVYLGKKELGTGSGRNKKSAEQEAARVALSVLQKG